MCEFANAQMPWCSRPYRLQIPGAVTRNPGKCSKWIVLPAYQLLSTARAKLREPPVLKNFQICTSANSYIKFT